MLFSVEQAFVGRNEIQAPLKMPSWEASAGEIDSKGIAPVLCFASSFMREKGSNILLTLSLPECLMEFCKLTLTFDSADQIP